MQQQDDALPPLDSLVLGQGQPTPNEPSTWAHASPVSMAPGTTAGSEPVTLRATDEQGYLDQNGPNGPGGVCGAAPTSEPAVPAPPPPAPVMIVQDTAALATPLIPDQPLPPGAPPALATAQSRPMPPAELSTPSTGLSTSEPHEPKARAHGEQPQPPLPMSPAPGLNSVTGPALPRDVGPLEKQTGRPHPYKPTTPAQIAEFAARWHDPAQTLDSICAIYKCGERTAQRWRTEFGLLPRDQAIRASLKAHDIMGSASGVVDRVNEVASLTGAMIKAGAMNPEIMPVPGAGLPPDRFDPLKDAEIVQALEEIKQEARMMTGHSDLQGLQRKLARLAVIASTKVPVRTWDGLGAVVEGLSRTILYMRRVEAEVPSSAADPVLLRKEAAAQMMREMKSVLTPQEQQALAGLVKTAADRLMAKAQPTEQQQEAGA